ncbi:hypothetical protein MLD38_011542 [Melastoma candidum]|uniref:Uncharacterized protein n=1 Tax=Melastoma candidum TaxID=119954 RepID=A0ACB9R3Y6_9MYRT|nr:hypothetical protein MLD38_011542 [Melastoma candidum]
MQCSPPHAATYRKPPRPYVQPVSVTNSPPNSPISHRNHPFLDLTGVDNALWLLLVSRTPSRMPWCGAGNLAMSSDLDWRSGDEVKTTKELMEDDWKSKKKKKKWMDNKKRKKDEKGDLRSFWKRALEIYKRFSKWNIRRKGSKASGHVSSIDGGDLSNVVVKPKEKDLTYVRESKDKVQRRSCDAVLVSEGRDHLMVLEDWLDSDNGSEGLVAQRLRRRFNRIITDMKRRS